MKNHKSIFGLANYCLVALISTAPQNVLAEAAHEDTWISPVALSANAAGLTISQQLFGRLVVRTEFSSKELGDIGFGIGKVDDENVKKLLDSGSMQSDAARYIEYLDSSISGPDADAFSFNVPDGFVDDAIALGGFDAERAEELRDTIFLAAKRGNKQDQLEARARAFRWFQEARQEAVRKSRARRQLLEELEVELNGWQFNKNVGMVVDIRTSIERPTISPLSLVTLQCEGESGNVDAPAMVFHEQSRYCDPYGVCRIESAATIDDSSTHNDVFESLRDDGRNYLDRCVITTRMLINGEEVTRSLPGQFTSNNSPQIAQPK